MPAERVYITKFALTKGIVTAIATVNGDNASITGRYPWERVNFGKLDWHRDVEKAQARAKSMAVAKANQLERESARLRGLEFPVQEEADV